MRPLSIFIERTQGAFRIWVRSELPSKLGAFRFLVERTQSSAQGILSAGNKLPTTYNHTTAPTMATDPPAIDQQPAGNLPDVYGVDYSLPIPKRLQFGCEALVIGVAFGKHIRRVCVTRDSPGVFKNEAKGVTLVSGPKGWEIDFGEQETTFRKLIIKPCDETPPAAAPATPPTWVENGELKCHEDGDDMMFAITIHDALVCHRKDFYETGCTPNADVARILQKRQKIAHKWKETVRKCRALIYRQQREKLADWWSTMARKLRRLRAFPPILRRLRGQINDKEPELRPMRRRLIMRGNVGEILPDRFKSRATYVMTVCSEVARMHPWAKPLRGVGFIKFSSVRGTIGIERDPAHGDDDGDDDGVDRSLFVYAVAAMLTSMHGSTAFVSGGDFWSSPRFLDIGWANTILIDGSDPAAPSPSSAFYENLARQVSDGGGRVVVLVDSVYKSVAPLCIHGVSHYNDADFEAVAAYYPKHLQLVRHAAPPAAAQADGADGELPLVREIFAMFDADGDGKLSKDEYEAYLRGAGIWAGYQPMAWDARWPQECRLLRSGTDGITRENFESVLYGEPRAGKAKSDLYSCRAFGGCAYQYIETLQADDTLEFAFGEPATIAGAGWPTVKQLRDWFSAHAEHCAVRDFILEVCERYEAYGNTRLAEIRGNVADCARRFPRSCAYLASVLAPDGSLDPARAYMHLLKAYALQTPPRDQMPQRNMIAQPCSRVVHMAGEVVLFMAAAQFAGPRDGYEYKCSSCVCDSCFRPTCLQCGALGQGYYLHGGPTLLQRNLSDTALDCFAGDDLEPPYTVLSRKAVDLEEATVFCTLRNGARLLRTQDGRVAVQDRRTTLLCGQPIDMRVAYIPPPVPCHPGGAVELATLRPGAFPVTPGSDGAPGTGVVALLPPRATYSIEKAVQSEKYVSSPAAPGNDEVPVRGYDSIASALAHFDRSVVAVELQYDHSAYSQHEAVMHGYERARQGDSLCCPTTCGIQPRARDMNLVYYTPGSRVDAAQEVDGKFWYDSKPLDAPCAFVVHCEPSASVQAYYGGGGAAEYQYRDVLPSASAAEMFDEQGACSATERVVWVYAPRCRISSDKPFSVSCAPRRHGNKAESLASSVQLYVRGEAKIRSTVPIGTNLGRLLFACRTADLARLTAPLEKAIDELYPPELPPFGLGCWAFDILDTDTAPWKSINTDRFWRNDGETPSRFTQQLPASEEIQLEVAITRSLTPNPTQWAAAKFLISCETRPLHAPFRRAMNDSRDICLLTGLVCEPERSSQYGGFVIADTGSGKTLVAALLMAARPLNTLYLAPSRQLQVQTCELLAQYFDVPGPADNIFRLRGGVTITVAAPNDLKDDVTGRAYGRIIVDEVHKLTDGTVRKLRDMQVRRFIGLSATFPEDMTQLRNAMTVMNHPLLHALPTMDFSRLPRDSDAAVKWMRLAALMWPMCAHIPASADLKRYHDVAKRVCLHRPVELSCPICRARVTTTAAQRSPPRGQGARERSTWRATESFKPAHCCNTDLHTFPCDHPDVMTEHDNTVRLRGVTAQRDPAVRNRDARLGNLGVVPRRPDELHARPGDPSFVFDPVRKVYASPQRPGEPWGHGARPRAGGTVWTKKLEFRLAIPDDPLTDGSRSGPDHYGPLHLIVEVQRQARGVEPGATAALFVHGSVAVREAVVSALRHELGREAVVSLLEGPDRSIAMKMRRPSTWFAVASTNKGATGYDNLKHCTHCWFPCGAPDLGWYQQAEGRLLRQGARPGAMICTVEVERQCMLKTFGKAAMNFVDGDATTYDDVELQEAEAELRIAKRARSRNEDGALQRLNAARREVLRVQTARRTLSERACIFDEKVAMPATPEDACATARALLSDEMCRSQQLRQQLATAAQSNDLQTMARLLREGVSADAKSARGRPAVFLVAFYGHLDALKLLHKHGANLDATTKHGATALMVATRYGKADCAEALLEWGADKDAADTNGDTALHRSAWKGQLECAQLLVRARADRAKKNKKGKTALDWARERGHAEVAALLEPAATLVAATSDAAPAPSVALKRTRPEGSDDGPAAHKQPRQQPQSMVEELETEDTMKAPAASGKKRQLAQGQQHIEQEVTEHLASMMSNRTKRCKPNKAPLAEPVAEPDAPLPALAQAVRVLACAEKGEHRLHVPIVTAPSGAARPPKFRMKMAQALAFEVGALVSAKYEDQQWYGAVVKQYIDNGPDAPGEWLIRWLDGAPKTGSVQDSDIRRLTRGPVPMVLAATATGYLDMVAPAEPNGVPLSHRYCVGKPRPVSERTKFHVREELGFDGNHVIEWVDSGHPWPQRQGGGAATWIVKTDLLQPIEQARRLWESRSKVSGRVQRSLIE